jgi:hypothetical protein
VRSSRSKEQHREKLLNVHVKSLCPAVGWELAAPLPLTASQFALLALSAMAPPADRLSPPGSLTCAEASERMRCCLAAASKSPGDQCRAAGRR